MSYLIAHFDPTVPTVNLTGPVNGSLTPSSSPGGSVQLSAPVSEGRVVISNISGNTIGLRLPDGSYTSINPGDVRLYSCKDWFSTLIQWWIRARLGTLNPSDMLFEYYDDAEPQLETYPTSTSRSIQVAAPSQVINENQPPFTSFIFAEPVGDTSTLGAFNATNSGFLQLGDATYQGDLTLSGPSGKTTTITNDTITTPTINFPVGSITRIQSFSGTANTTPTFFNHGLGVIPDVVLIQGNGTSSTLHTFFVDYATMTTTQVKITNDSVGRTPFVGLAIKF